MASEGVRVDGLKEVVRQLKRMGVEASDLKAAFHAIGLEVSSEIKGLTPTLTGKLSNSVRPSKQQNQAVIRAGGARVPYAGVQNYGGYNNITGKHFMQEGLHNKQDYIEDELERELQKLINKLFGG